MEENTLPNDNIITIEQKKPRLSNFELLRIICMILIVAHHFSVHSSFDSDISTFNYYLSKALAIGGKIGVNAYVLISGYFMINSTFKFKKLLKLILETAFYSSVIYIIFCIFGLLDFNLLLFIRHCRPIYKQHYWFMTYFVLLYILSPYLNKCLNNCSKKEFYILIAVLLFCQLDILGLNSIIFFNELVWFVTLYVIASFIKLYPNKYTNSNKIMIPFMIASFVVIILTRALTPLLYDTLTHIVCLACSVSVFCVFKNINIKNCKFINVIASTTLGVYLIHDNIHIREYIWNYWLNTPNQAHSDWFWLYSILSIILVFVVCSAIDYLRQLVVKLIIKYKNKKSPPTKV